MIEAYVYSSCSSCRKTLDELQESGEPFRSRDYFKESFTRGELESLLDKVNLTPSMVLSTRSRAYRDREIDAESISDADLLDLMVEEPTLIRRPIVINGDKVVIGHNPRRLAELIAT